jgi:hypothetical protein
LKVLHEVPEKLKEAQQAILTFGGVAVEDPENVEVKPKICDSI